MYPQKENSHNYIEVEISVHPIPYLYARFILTGRIFLMIEKAQVYFITPEC